MMDVEFIQRVLTLANDTDALIWAIRRSLILMAVVMALTGLMTLLNFWILRKTIVLMREVLKLVRDLIDEHTR